MSGEASALLEVNEDQPATATEEPVKLRIARHPVRDRIGRLVDLTARLLEEAERLSQDRAFTDESNRLRSLNLAQGIDFYDEVQRFESGLIKLALERTGGNQAKAARLLRIKPTTLNSKIKLFQIEY
jgi:transcriptional regulator with GAF, ATPase, and Fis domain